MQSFTTTTAFRALTVFAFTAVFASAQVTVPLPGRSLVKLLPDYSRPRVYALNRANGSVSGTLLALNPTNGAVLNEITLNLNPTDMAISPGGDTLYVVNTGSRTITKVNLASFAVVTERAISTPNTYSLSNPLYIAATQNGMIYYTDGAWGPEIYALDYNSGAAQLVLDTGGNQAHGAGGIALNRSGSNLYVWKQYGWSAGNVNSWVTRYATASNGALTSLEDSFSSWRRDPFDTPILLDAGERWVFNKQQMFNATNVTILLNQFSENIYAISLDGSVAFGPTQVFNTQNGTVMTNLPFSATVQTLSGDQAKLFRYNASTTNLVIYDMGSIAPVSGPNLAPTPADRSVVSLPLTNLSWTISPTALAYDVYFGTNQAAVAAANPSSAQYLGRVTTPPQPLPPLAPGVTYYWRVDSAGFNATNTGAVWSFTVATLAVTPPQITSSAVAGYNAANMALSLTSTGAVTWTAAVTGAGWVSLTPASGSTPTNVSVIFNTASLAAGDYTNNIEFTAGSIKLTVPVALKVKPLNIVKMIADRQRPFIYALQPPSLAGQNGLLLFINTINGNIDRTLPIGTNPVDLSINDAEGRLYIASWTETWTYVVDLNTQTLLPSLNLGSDVYKINAGRAGRIVIEGEDQWITVALVNTLSGAALSTSMFRQGDGAFDPTGRYYYHGDDNISGAGITKYDTGADTFASVASAGGHYYYGSRNVVLSQNGARLFWTSAVYDANLVDLGTLGAEIYSCSTNGAVAFSATQAYDTASRQVIYNLPTSSSVSVVDGRNERFWFFNSISATLGSIPLTTIESPSITQQPASSTSVTVGGSVYLTVTAMGLTPLSYQWTMFGTNIPGATNYFLSFPNAQRAQQGDYNVIVSNPFGSVTSSVAHLTVLIAPSIVTQSSNTTVSAGQSFSLSVTPAGTAPFTYRWMFENTNIGGVVGVSQTLTLSNAQAYNEGIYRVAVSNGAGSVTSAPIFVRVTPAGPGIVAQPQSTTVSASSNVLFNVSAVGSQPLAYQWFFGGLPIAGATASQYALLGAQSTNAGAYQVTVSNALGVATSAVATLTVAPLAPYFVTQPAGAAVSAGSSRTLSGAANGSQPIAYQWQFNGSNIAGAVQTSLVLTNLGLTNSGAYTLVASNVAGLSTSAVAQITVYQNATLVQGLSNVVVDVNSTVTVAVNALGSPTLAYSWQFNGQPIAATNSTLILSNIQPAQAGYYRVTVTNPYGSVSSTGRISVLGLPSQVASWGDNSGRQTNVPANAADVVAVAGGDYHTLALRHTGTLLAWGYNGEGQTNVPTNMLRFVSVASGAAHNVAITESGSVVAWGRNDAGQCTVPAAASNGVLSVAAGDAHSLALLYSGVVVAWGDNTFDQSSVPKGLVGVRNIAAGRNHSLAVRTNGSVVGWGFNTYGQSSAPVLTNAVAVSAGYLHSVALLSNGTVLVWGDNTFGQTNVPPGLTNVIGIAAGDFHTYALRADGTVFGWGDDSYGQLDGLSGLNNVSSVASGNYHGLALMPVSDLLQQSIVSSKLVIRWSGTGTLQSAPNPAGPYADVTASGNIYTNSDMSGPAKFFRLRR